MDLGWVFAKQNMAAYFPLKSSKSHFPLYNRRIRSFPSRYINNPRHEIDVGLPSNCCRKPYLLGTASVVEKKENAQAALRMHHVTVRIHRRIWITICHVYRHLFLQIANSWVCPGFSPEGQLLGISAGNKLMPGVYLIIINTAPIKYDGAKSILLTEILFPTLENLLSAAPLNTRRS